MIFFSFVDDNIYNDDINININKVAKWLNIHKYAIKKTLINTYIKNIDYKIIVTKHIKQKRGGHNKENIFITSDTFKHICMSTKSINGKKVQQYYIAIEKIMYKYYKYLLHAQNKKIKQLELKQKSSVYPKRAVIYVFQTSDSSNNNPLYKIGKSTHLKSRIKSHQSSLAHNINILFYYETDNIDAIESCVKLFLKKYQYRKYKEIYKCKLEVIKELIENCDMVGLKVNRKMIKHNLPKMKKGGAYYIKINYK